MENPSTALERALIENALEMLLAFEDIPEDQLELETAVKLEEGIAATIQGLDAQSRARFVAIARELADEWDRDEWKHSGDRLREALLWLDVEGSPPE